METIPAGQMVPYHFVGHDYALPEEVVFNVLFYRQDLFDQYSLSVPHTWEDSQKMVSTLQQNHMNFWLQWGDWITFYYQLGMDPYTPDGLEIKMDNEQGFAIFKYWSELYTKYNFPQRIGSFYQNFRYGYIPIGVSSLQDYFLLKLAAPELTGVWRIAPIPGMEDSEGDILRYQSGDQRGVMLFKTDEEREAAGWEFLKWWMDTETQKNYALDLESAFGQEFRWFSGNPEVVKAIPWDENDRKVILTQLSWFKGIPYTPGGSYMLEREMKNALSSVVIDKKNYRDMLEEATKATRKEMDKTLKEFGFLDEQGNVLKTMDILEVPKPVISE
jgi:ABC-type glycerol-3-phosphate transport system substrate-binding protein